MALINGEIAKQSFELVRDRIGEILADELANQYDISSNEDLNADVWVERIAPFDKTELPAVNVTLARGDYNGQTAIQSDGTYLFNIDCFSQAKTSDTENADVKAMMKLQRLMGVCRAIIEDAQYVRLGFAPPFVMNRKITQIGVADIKDLDATSSVMGRLVLSVKVPENVELLQPVLLDTHHTSVKLSLTDKGYLFIANQS